MARRSVLIQRRYSSSQPVSKDFYEWLCGFTDGEGTFIISQRTDSTYSFRYQLHLHVDDIDVLYFIQNTLGIGKVSSSGNSAMYRVSSLKELARVIEIFSNYPLNTTKFLNFLDFKKAFTIYTSSNKTRGTILEEVNRIKSGFNSKRSYFSTTTSKSGKPRITPY